MGNCQLLQIMPSFQHLDVLVGEVGKEEVICKCHTNRSTRDYFITVNLNTESLLTKVHH